MKNIEIIAQAAVAVGLMNEDEAQRCIESGADIPLHSLGGWNRHGKYRVKDGETGIEVKLWKRKDDGDGFYMAKTYLYTEDQIEEC